MGAPEKNNNAEKWTLEEATEFLNKALEISKDPDYDYIGEVAKAMDSYIDVFKYLTDKFPQLEYKERHIKRNCEVNCFSNSKKGKIKEATAIVNLKSNHGWTDRVHEDKDGELIIRVHHENKGS